MNSLTFFLHYQPAKNIIVYQFCQLKGRAEERNPISVRPLAETYCRSHMQGIEAKRMASPSRHSGSGLSLVTFEDFFNLP